MSTKAKTVPQVKYDEMVRASAADAAKLRADLAEAQRKLKAAEEKVSELEILKEALLELVRKLKKVVPAGAWLAMLAPIVLASGLIFHLLTRGVQVS